MKGHTLEVQEYMCFGGRCLEAGEYFEQEGTGVDEYELEKDLPTQIGDICDNCW